MVDKFHESETLVAIEFEYFQYWEIGLLQFASAWEIGTSQKLNHQFLYFIQTFFP